MKKPLILITNDDGIQSPGIKNLINWARPFGEIWVVAPASPRSGASHSISMGDPLRVEPVSIFHREVRTYKCNGTPVDCIKIARSHLMKSSPPDLILSGINHGDNTSISVLYSGTVSAAIEGSLGNVPSLAFSLCDYDEKANMTHIEDPLKEILRRSLDRSLPKSTMLNVNFPIYDSQNPIRGIRVCRQTKARWQEYFEPRTDLQHREYLWMDGKFEEDENSEKHLDRQAIRERYVSIVPCQPDMTNYALLDILQKKWT
ncbi:MAG: 5'/3'-nucleotidase SurE [Cytophagales bacterium]|nr:5'/3'-nucleotidase SurE [Cytophagales bacterium]